MSLFFLVISKYLFDYFMWDLVLLGLLIDAVITFSLRSASKC